MNPLARLIRGARWSEDFGAHPGTPLLAWLFILGGVAGGWPGALLLPGAFLPLWLVGCWARASRPARSVPSQSEKQP